jgi:zinc transport system permease protein
MIEILQYDFMRNALLAGVLAAVATGVVGSLVVVNRVVFISGGIAHAAYGGVGLALFFGLDPLLGATFFGLAVALSMGTVQRRSRQRVDTMIGVMWAVGMAIGVVFVDLTPGYKADLMSFLFGSILAVPGFELILMALLDLVVVAFVALYFRPLLAVSYDETFTRVRNLPVAALQLALLCLVALSVVLLMRVVGLILVIAMLTIPAAVGSRFTRSLKGMMVLSVVLGIAFNLTGLAISYAADLTSGATIILVAAVAFMMVTILPWPHRDQAP